MRLAPAFRHGPSCPAGRNNKKKPRRVGGVVSASLAQLDAYGTNRLAQCPGWDGDAAMAPPRGMH